MNSEWEIIISDAEEKLRDVEKKLRSLKNHRAALQVSIRLFGRKMEAGEPLPEGLSEFRLEAALAGDIVICARCSQLGSDSALQFRVHRKRR